MTDEEASIPDQPVLAALRRYAHDNPLAMVAGVAILGMLLARFTVFARNAGRSVLFVVAECNRIV